MPKLFNTYIEGMDRDTSFSHYSNKRYYNMRNMRHVHTEDMSFTKLTVMPGNVSANLHFYGQTIIGSGRIRDRGIIITTDCSTNNPGGVDPDLTADPPSRGRIFEVHYNNDEIAGESVIYAPEFGTGGYMNLTTKHPINNEIYCYYDNENLQKIYWVDHFNLLRHLNIEHADLPHNLAADKLDIVPDVEMSQAYLKSIGSGNLNVGVVQYAYQLYDLGGGETTFSPASPLYTISKSNEFAANTKEYKGSAKLDSSGNLTNSGKSFNVQIDNIDTAFDKIKIVSIHYSTVDSTPTINVVSILDVTSSVNVWDSGSYQLGTISLEEFRTLGGNLIIPKTLSVKDNILFAGNIKQKYFDVDFDARAYRFRNYDGTASIWNSGTGFDDVYKGGSAWPNGTYLANDSPVPATHNCVNPYNYNPVGGVAEHIATYTSGHWAQCIYQSDLSTIGGEGPNVKYEIKSEASFTIMHTPYDGDYYVNKTSETAHSSMVTKPNPTASYTDYANPYHKRFLGYKRNEIYRFGIVFFNNKGQQSFVKWIADIKMPTNSQFQIAKPLGPPIDRTDIYELAVDFYVDTSGLSSDITGYQIVRVKREEKDKTIVASGILNHTAYVDSCSYAPPISMYYDSMNYINASITRKLLTFISPEVNYYKNLSYNTGDVIFAEGTMGWKMFQRMIGNYEGGWSGCAVQKGTGNEIEIKHDYRHDIQVTYKGIGTFGATEGVYKAVEDGRILEPCNEANYESNEVTINGNDYANYVRVGYNRQKGPAGTQYVLGVDSEMSSSILGTDAHDVFYVDYIRNNVPSIYGGMYYVNRQLNEYIPAGELVKIADSYEWFLPSKDELVAIRTNLYLYGVGNLTNNHYHSSSEFDAEFAYGIDFFSGSTDYNEKGIATYVRACRSFTAGVGDYSLRDTGPASGLIFYISGTTYYEAAPSDQSTNQVWSNIINGLVGTNTAIGTGQANTTAIIGQAGHTDSAAKLCDDYVVTLNWNPMLTVWGGDTYIHMFEHLMVAMDAEDYDGDGDPDIEIQDRIGSWVRFPVETSINLSLTHGEKRLITRNGLDRGSIHEAAGEYKNIAWTTTDAANEEYVLYSQTEDMYLYNSVYSQQNTSKTFYPEPADWAAIKDYDTLVYNSDTKMKGSDIDAWLKFRVNNEIDLDSSYGPLQKLLLFKSNMIFFQDNAFGTLSVRQRQLLQTEGGGSLELGSGGILDRFDLLSTETGCKHPTSILVTDNAFYWYDAKKYNFNRYAGKLENLSTDKNMYSFFKNINSNFLNYTNIAEGSGIIVGYNRKYKEIHLTFKDSGTPANDETVVFSEFLNKFTGFCDCKPLLYIDHGENFYTSPDLDWIYHEDSGAPGQYFTTWYDIVLELIVNPNNGVVNVFNNFEYYSKMYNVNGAVEIDDITWGKIQMLNEYQDSDEITVVPGTNVKRRMRAWRFKDFRDNTNRRIRFRDFYQHLIFTLNPPTGSVPNVYRFEMHDLATYFSVPAESLAR